VKGRVPLHCGEVYQSKHPVQCPHCTLSCGGIALGPTLLLYPLGLVALVWCFLMRYWLWPTDSAARHQPIAPSKPRRRQRSSEPHPFAGLRPKPPGALCEPEAVETAPAPLGRPAPMPPTHRRPRTVDTATPFCPQTAGAYRGGLGLGSLRATGQPHGGPGRQLHGRGCNGSLPEPQGTILPGTRVTVALLVRGLAGVAQGWGRRATARGFEVDPNPVRHWLGEAAEQLRAFPSSLLGDVPVCQLQLDELYAVWRGIKDGAIRPDEALKRLERARHWGWTALEPARKLLLPSEPGPRTLAMAPRVLHQAVQGLAPDLGAPVSHGWMQGIPDSLAAPRGPGGTAGPAPGPGPSAHPPLVAVAPAARCASGQDRAAPASGRRAAPRRVRHDRGRPADPEPAGLSEQDGLGGAAHPGHSSARRSGRTAGQHAAPGRGQRTAFPGLVPRLAPLRAAPCELAPAVGRTHPDQRHGRSHAVAAVYASAGGGMNRSGVVAHRGGTVQRAAVATTSSAGTAWPGREASNGAGAVCRQAGKEDGARGSKWDSRPDAWLLDLAQTVHKGAAAIIRSHRVRDQLFDHTRLSDKRDILSVEQQKAESEFFDHTDFGALWVRFGPLA